VVAYGSGWDRYALSPPAFAHCDDGLRRRHTPARRANLRRDAGRLESVGTGGLGLSRFMPAGEVLGMDLVYLSATVRGNGELARFRPGGVVDPYTGCCFAGPRGADVD
jgi:hypothetical protein